MNDVLPSSFRASAFLTATTLIAGLLAALNTFSVSLALPPFWVDLATGGACLAVAISWLTNLQRDHGIQDLYHFERALGANRLRACKRALAQRRILALHAIPGLLVLAAALFLITPVRHLFRPSWVVCGTFITRCQNSCLIFLEERNREVTGRCSPREDDSGYRTVQSKKFWTYRPSRVAVECDGKIGRTVDLPENMFSPSCAGVWRE